MFECDPEEFDYEKMVSDNEPAYSGPNYMFVYGAFAVHDSRHKIYG